MNSNDLWAALGDLEAEQAATVLIELFSRYEKRCVAQPDDPEARTFFQQLAASLAQVRSCNVSRR